VQAALETVEECAAPALQRDVGEFQHR
jgi:hypothetical protein